MTPDQAIAALDRANRRSGERVGLQRVTGTTVVEIACWATVRGFKPVELIAGISQTDALVIIGPTEISQAQWPGAGTATDPRLPRANQDRVVVGGRPRVIAAVAPFYVAGDLVRLELRVTG